MPTQLSCDTLTVFSGGGSTGPVNVILTPQTGGTAITLTPSPFVNIRQEKFTNGSQVVGGVWKITLNGTIVENGFDNTTGELLSILNSFEKSDCVLVEISKCQGANYFIYGYGRILSASFEQGNQPTWVNLIPYSIEIELYTNANSPSGVQEPVILPATGLLSSCILSSYDESFSVSVGEDAFNWDEVPGPSPTPSPDVSRIGNQHISISFKMSATGISGNQCAIGDPDYFWGLDAAERAICDRLDDITTLDMTSLLQSADLSSKTGDSLVTELNMYNSNTRLMELRNVNINTIQQSIEVDGQLIIRPSGCPNPNLFTTMSVEESVDGDGRTVTISGNVTAVVNTGFSASEIIKYAKFNCDTTTINGTSTTKRMELINNFLNSLSNNTTLLQDIANSSFHKRNSTETYLSDSCSSSSINDPCGSSSPAPSPILCSMRLISSQLSRDYGQGTGSFSFVLSNQPNCSILGAKKVDVDITHDKPADNIVEIIVPGRGNKGVLIQNICCKTAEKYSIRANAVLNSNLCGYNSTQMTNTYSTFKTCIDNLISTLAQQAGVDARCWFLVEDSESLGNTTYSISRQYVKPSCP